MPAFVDLECKQNAEISQDNIVHQWVENFKSIPIPYLETLGDAAQQLMESQRRKSSTGADVAVASGKDAIGYDVITNLCGEGYFVASLSVDREEICVWDVPRCMKVRTLRGIPQPASLCPVGEYGAAVLCRREIKVIDLNEGAFKVKIL